MVSKGGSRALRERYALKTPSNSTYANLFAKSLQHFFSTLPLNRHVVMSNCGVWPSAGSVSLRDVLGYALELS